MFQPQFGLPNALYTGFGGSQGVFELQIAAIVVIPLHLVMPVTKALPDSHVSKKEPTKETCWRVMVYIITVYIFRLT